MLPAFIGKLDMWNVLISHISHYSHSPENGPRANGQKLQKRGFQLCIRKDSLATGTIINI